jgi:hypothetical protein
MRQKRAEETESALHRENFAKTLTATFCYAMDS